MEQEYVYVFMGENSIVPSGIYKTYNKANEWIEKNSLSGGLHKLPIDISLYDWATKQDYFTPKTESQSGPKFIQTFSCASVDHWHFEDGKEG